MSRKNSKLTKHHLRPKSRSQNPSYNNRPKNIILLPWGMHKAYHQLFGVKTLQESINALWNLHKSGIEITRFNIYIIYVLMVKTCFANGQISYLIVFITQIIKIAKIQKSYFVLFGNNDTIGAIRFLETWRVGCYKKIRRRPSNT